jgi:hypothetical protein
VFLSKRGSFLGQQVAANSPSRVRRLKAQLRTADDDQRCLWETKVVIGQAEPTPPTLYWAAL